MYIINRSLSMSSSEDEVRHSSLPRKRYSYFECSGSEETLLECQHTGPYPYQCNSALYAGVLCTTEQEGQFWVGDTLCASGCANWCKPGTQVK